MVGILATTVQGPTQVATNSCGLQALHLPVLCQPILYCSSATLVPHLSQQAADPQI